jgi:hypothetical protein
MPFSLVVDGRECRHSTSLLFHASVVGGHIFLMVLNDEFGVDVIGVYKCKLFNRSLRC